MSLQGLDRLETKIDRLRREYDLFLAGRRRGEPVSLRDEVRREVLALTRHPWSSTVGRFRAKGLAHRFQALESQVRHVLEIRTGRKPKGPAEPPRGVEVLIDRSCLQEKGVFLGCVAQLHRRLLKAAGDAKPPAIEALSDRIEAEVRRRLQEPGVVGVRFRVAEGEGALKIRGELVRTDAPGNEPIP